MSTTNAYMYYVVIIRELQHKVSCYGHRICGSIVAVRTSYMAVKIKTMEIVGPSRCGSFFPSHVTLLYMFSYRKPI